MAISNKIAHSEVLFGGISFVEKETTEYDTETDHAEVLAPIAQTDIEADVPLAEGANSEVVQGDARNIPLENDSVDLVITSPPYWKKRDYGVADQIGQEPTVGEYVEAILDALHEWRRVLRSTGSVFLNIGDTYHNKSLAGVPACVEHAACDAGWIVRNRII